MTQTIDFQDIRSLKQRIADALIGEGIENIRVQKRFFKSQYGETHWIGYAVKGDFVTTDHLNNDVLPCLKWERDSIVYAYESKQHSRLEAKFRLNGLNARIVWRGKNMELIIAEPRFVWGAFNKVFQSFRFNNYRITKS